MTTRVPSELNVVAETIASERQLLEHLLFRLVEARLVLAADESRFVAQATAEVEDVIDALRMSELKRSASVDRLAMSMGRAADDITLGYLVDHSPEPYGAIFRHHRDAIGALAIEIERLTLENRRLASAAARNVSETLDAIIGSPAITTYTAGGTTSERATVLQRTLDEVL